MASAYVSPATRSAATTTSWCATACRSYRRPHQRRGAAPVPRVHRLGAHPRGRARQPGAWAGAVSTTCCSIAPPVRGSSSARSSPTCRCRWTRRWNRTAGAARPASTPPHRRHRRALPVDARRCISYLTIELHGAIPRSCARCSATASTADDCQLVCPWNRFAQRSGSPISPPPGLDDARLAELFAWTARSSRAHPQAPDPPHRPRALAAQHRGRARQRPGDACRARGLARNARTTRTRWCASTSPGRSPARTPPPARMRARKPIQDRPPWKSASSCWRPLMAAEDLLDELNRTVWRQQQGSTCCASTSISSPSRSRPCSRATRYARRSRRTGERGRLARGRRPVAPSAGQPSSAPVRLERVSPKAW